MADRPGAGMLGQFGTPDRLITAARAAHDAGARGLDAFTPYPIDELIALIVPRERRIAWIGFGGGIAGAVFAYAMQIGTNLDYPLDIGGRPLIALQAFALIGFELTVLFAVGAMVLAFFVLNRLPRYHRPIFDVERFEHATRDGFFLFVPSGKPEPRALLERLGADTIDVVPQ